MNEKLSKYDDLLLEIRQQRVLLLQIISAVNVLQNSQKNGYKKHKKFQIFYPGITFVDLQSTIDQHIKLTAHELMKFKDQGYVKAIMVFLTEFFKGFGENEIPIKIIDRRRKIFYIKTENCWCAEKEYNDKQFDIFLDIFSHFIYKACFNIHTQTPEQFSILTMNDIQNIILQARLDSAMNKRIRYRFLNNF